MAAAMAAMTMVTNNKGGSLAMDKKKWFLPPLPDRDVAFRWSSRPECRSLDFPRRALFASIGLSLSVGAPPGSRQYDEKARPAADVAGQLAAAGEAAVQQAMEPAKAKKKQPGLRKVRVKIGNPHLRRLVSGAIAGAVSRTFVAPLETIRTHLMVGSSGVDDSMAGVFRWIMRTEGWPGLFRGNAVNVLRVAPSKAIEHFVYDTAKKHLSPEAGEPAKVPVPTPLVAGALAGVASTLCTYPMELVKTRLTIEKDAYDNLLHAFVKIARDEGPEELYRGLAPSLIGVVPYAATNFYAYETLRGVYRRATGKEEVGNVPTLLIGSAAGAIASAATFPLEVARKQMQVGAVGGRQVYKNLLHAMYCILSKEGAAGLYRGLGPSCIKLMPAAGISFMCYEACKKILVEDDVDDNGVEPREETGQAAPKKSNGDRT